MTEDTKQTIDGWTIITTIEQICLTCIVEAGESADMGTTINTSDKVISVYHRHVVDHFSQCDYLTEHVEKTLGDLVDEGKLETFVVDGVTKYRPIN